VNEQEGYTALVSSLLEAKSVALVGASSGSGNPWTGPRKLTRRFLRTSDAQVALVNPARESIYGVPGYPSLMAVPFAVDLAVVSVSASNLTAAVADVREKKVGTCVVHTAHVPRAVKDVIGQIASTDGIRFIGPNSAGIIDAKVGLDAMPGATGVSPLLGLPGVLVISQSGGFCTEAVLRLGAVGVPIRAAISTGDELDVTAEDVLEAYLGWPQELRCVLLFMETSRNPAKLVKVIRSALDTDVPVGVVKIGRTAASAAAAFSHTGALVGDWACFAAAMVRDGATMCESVEELCDFAVVSSRGGTRGLPGRSVALVSNSGGIAGLSSDLVADCGLSMAEFSRGTKEALAARLDGPHEVWNPLDLGDVPGLTLEDYLETVQHEADLDVIVVEVRGGIPYGPDAEVLRVMAQRIGKPVWLCWPGIEARACAELIEAGIPVLQDTRRLWRLLDKSTVSASRASMDYGPDVQPDRPALPARTGMAALPYARARVLARDIGIPQPSFAVVTSKAELAAAVNGGLAVPVAMKISSAEVTHKTDVGGVVLNVGDIDQALTAYERLMSVGGVEAVVVEEMIPVGPELLLSARQTDFGVLISVGWGGTNAEAVADVASVMLPATDVELVRAIRSTRAWEALKRGRDGRALAADAQQICQLMRRFGTYVKSAGLTEIEANPIIAGARGLLAADIRIVCRVSSSEE
jgi:acetate---CoA ligase (ADP-forming)